MCLAAYKIFLCSCFIASDYGEPYQFYAVVVLILSLFLAVGTIRDA